MDGYTSITLGISGIAFLFAYLFSQMKEENNMPYKRMFFILFLFLVDSAIFTGLMIAQEEGLTVMINVLQGLFVGMLGITMFFLYMYVFKTFFETIGFFKKNAGGAKYDR